MKKTQLKAFDSNLTKQFESEISEVRAKEEAAQAKLDEFEQENKKLEKENKQSTRTSATRRFLVGAVSESPSPRTSSCRCSITTRTPSGIWPAAFDPAPIDGHAVDLILIYQAQPLV